MQAVIALPEFTARIDRQKAAELLMHPVAGVPLLKRIVLTAIRAGATDILLICPEDLEQALSQKFSQAVFQHGSRIRVIQFGKFDPRASSSWARLEAHLNDQFLWIPWNWITTKQFLINLPLLTMTSVDWARPARISFDEVVRDHPVSAPPLPQTDGVRVISPDSYVFGREFVELTQGSNPSPAYHGQATLSRWKISNSRILR